MLPLPCHPVPAPTADVAGNRIAVLPGGPERMAALLQLIDGAATSLRLMFYIYAADDSGARVRDALARAAARGVRVSVLLDSFGSARTPDAFFSAVRAAGGAVHWFGTRWTPRYLIRNHQKLVIADERHLLSGGFNIEDAYFADAADREGWCDLGFTLEGAAVAPAVRWFDRLFSWTSAPRPRFRDLRRAVRDWRDEGERVQWLVGGPTVRLSPWARTLYRQLRAGRSVVMAMAYFAPSTGVLRRIGRIARGGGRTMLLLPARSDNAATVGAARLLYAFLLKRAVHIAEYEPQRLHAKLIVIDDSVMIGSANLDMRSLYVNMELMLCVCDAGFARACSAWIDERAGEATAITPALHRSRGGILNRLRWFASWLIVSVIDYGVTRRLNFGLRDDG